MHKLWEVVTQKEVYKQLEEHLMLTDELKAELSNIIALSLATENIKG